MSESVCPRCGHPGVHHSRGDNGLCEDCDRCWSDHNGATARRTTSIAWQRCA